MAGTKSGVLTGVERLLVHNRLRAAIGLRWEMPRVLQGAEIPPGARCLEVGTGFGWGALGLARHIDTAHVVAIDYDGSVLPHARGLHERGGVRPRIQHCQADANALPFADGAFDLVLALYVLHHTGDYRASLREIGRVLKAGGLFVFADPVHVPYIPRLRRIVPPDGLPDWPVLAALAGDAGLQLERRRGLPFFVFGQMRKVAVASEALIGGPGA